MWSGSHVWTPRLRPPPRPCTSQRAPWFEDGAPVRKRVKLVVPHQKLKLDPCRGLVGPKHGLIQPRLSSVIPRRDAPVRQGRPMREPRVISGYRGVATSGLCMYTSWNAYRAHQELGSIFSPLLRLPSIDETSKIQTKSDRRIVMVGTIGQNVTTDSLGSHRIRALRGDEPHSSMSSTEIGK